MLKLALMDVYDHKGMRVCLLVPCPVVYMYREFP
jgi:hypothetical protein